jgi:hypothetical protein
MTNRVVESPRCLRLLASHLREFAAEVRSRPSDTAAAYMLEAADALDDRTRAASSPSAKARSHLPKPSA